jgi:hypothetical protein
MLALDEPTPHHENSLESQANIFAAPIPLSSTNQPLIYSLNLFATSAP